VDVGVDEAWDDKLVGDVGGGFDRYDATVAVGHDAVENAVGHHVRYMSGNRFHWNFN